MNLRRTLVLLAAAALVATGCSNSTDPLENGSLRKAFDIAAVGVGDLVWVDADGDGVQDMDEPGLEGVEVRLLDCAGAPLDTFMTNVDGQYGFGSLEPGDYSVWFGLPDGYTFSPLQQGGDPETDSDVAPETGVTACLRLAEDEVNLSIDAGLVPDKEPAHGAVGDRIWHDDNGDGIQDEGEMGIEGVEVRLWECNGAVLDTTWSDPRGAFGFKGLAAGTYMLQFVLPEGYEFSPMHAGEDTTRDSDPDPATGITACFDLAADTVDRTRDAGLVMMDQGENCTYGKGYWKNHTGCLRGDDLVTDLLPQFLGTVGGEKTIEVSDNCEAFAVLSGRPACADKCGCRRGMSNGIVKLYAHLLTTKLNVANGADDTDIADTVDEVDAFLADNDWHAWDCLDRDERHMVHCWKDALEDYNEGRTGPGHCDRCGCPDDCDDEDEEDEEDEEEDDEEEDDR